jgi:hypothetical protein
MAPRHPVQFRVEARPQRARISVVIRLSLLLAIGVVGYSAIYWLLYFSIPALVAMLILQKGADHYHLTDAPRIVRGLRWLAGAYAYLWLLTDVIPTTDAGGPVDLEVELTGRPTATSCLLRLVYSLPAMLLAVVLSLASALLWVFAAIVILVNERMPAAIAEFLTLTLRYQSRLVAYHLSLVDRYPSFQESPLAHVAT